LITETTVSVIIPTYNRAHVLAAAIESVLLQEYENLEIIVVDDGSFDETDKVLSAFKDKIKTIKTENRGVSAARNKGIKASGGKLISFLDSDDIWEKNKLKKQLAALKENPGFRVIYTNEKWIRNGKRVNQCKIHRKYGGNIIQEMPSPLHNKPVISFN